MMFPISPSKLMVARCGRALDLLNKDTPADTPEFENTLLGSELHDVLHEINCYDGPIDDTVLDLIMERCCSHAFETQRRYALKYIENFPYHSVCMSEYSCGVDENLLPTDYETAVYRGRIDAIIAEAENRLCIVDHKSAWNVYKPDTEQLRFYAWLLSKIHPHIEEFSMSIYFIRYGQWEKTDFHLGRKAIANIERSVKIAARAAWNTQLGVPTPGKYCAFCNYCLSCPAAAANVNVIASEQDAIDIAKSLHVMKKQMTEMSGLIQRYAKEHGFIPIDGDFGYGYGERASEEVKVEDVLEALKENPQVIKALKVDMKALKRLKLDLPTTTRYSSKWGAFQQGSLIEDD